MKLLEGFEIEMMNEEERNDPPDVRNPKHWQLFHVVARKYCQRLLLPWFGIRDESKKPSSCSVVKIEDTGCVVRTVTDKVESYYLVANVGTSVGVRCKTPPKLTGIKTNQKIL